MTKRRDFKALVRERMDKTGERYTAARAQLLGKSAALPPASHAFPGVLPGYDTFGGIQSGTAAVRNTLASIGRVSPLDGGPYTESLVNGLCGGPGFLYAVFEYKGWPPMLSLALRSRSMPDVYIAEGLSRVGMKVTTSETTSPVAARKALDAALAEGKPALCVTDAASLPWTGLPKAFVGGGPHVRGVSALPSSRRPAPPTGRRRTGWRHSTVPSRDTTPNGRFATPSRIPPSATSNRRSQNPSG
jgi:hypothetical protein